MLAVQMCEAALGARNTADHVKTPSERRGEQFRLYVQQQAAAGGLHGVAGAWEGGFDQLPPAPRSVATSNAELLLRAFGCHETCPLAVLCAGVPGNWPEHPVPLQAWGGTKLPWA